MEQISTDLMNSIFGTTVSSSSENINIRPLPPKLDPPKTVPSKLDPPKTVPITILTDVYAALDEYFTLKRDYEDIISKNKKLIINNLNMSNKEKRSQYLKLKPKCINCKRPGGTIFKNTFFPDNDNIDSYRQYSATCGIIADPCYLDIKIQIGKIELLSEFLNTLQKEISDTKNEIINNKNKLLFGYLTSENVLEEFEELKETINLYSKLYESYLNKYNNIIDNDKIKTEISETTTDLYVQITQIKECIKQMNKTNNVQFASDAANIYATIIQPLFNKIRTLKYDETRVWHNVDLNTCNLIQTKHSISHLSYSSFQDKVVSYNIGVQTTTNKKKLLIIESDEDEEPVKTQTQTQTQIEGNITDEPTYVDGGIKWNNPKYKLVWNKMPIKLKNVLMVNHEWMKDFMFNYINQKNKTYGYDFTPPAELKIPPDKLASGEYDFGVKIYNDVFKKLDASLQKTNLSFYSEKNGIKNYDMLRNSMNDYVSAEVGFNKGFF